MQPMVCETSPLLASKIEPETYFMSLAGQQVLIAHAVKVQSGPQTEPFHSAQEAWMWTMAALIARREGARFSARKGLVTRPCEPDDVVKCLDGLYRQRRIDLAHARVLRIWGERQMTPSCVVVAERFDYKLWTEALGRLEWPLRIKGIVV